MATAGSITVDLLMKTGTFETDANRAAKVADKRAKEIAASFKQAGVVIGTAIATGLTATVVALKESINTMDALSKAAERVGLPTEEFSRLNYAASLADVSLESLQSSLGKLTKSQAAALNTTSQQAKVFDALGISIKNADGSLRDSGDVLADFADAFKALDGSPEAIAAGFTLFGRSFQDIIPLIKDGSRGLRDAGAEADALGVTLSTRAGKQAEEFNDNLTRLKSAAKGLALQVASDLLPELVKLTNNLVALSKDGDRMAEVAHGIGTALDAVGGVIKFVGGYFTAFGNYIEGATEEMYGFIEAAKGIANFDWDQIKRGMETARQGRDIALFGNSAKPENNKSGGKKPLFITADSGQIPDSAFSQSSQEAALQARNKQLQDSLQKALGGGHAAGGGAGKVASAGLSDEQQAAKALQASYDALIAQQKEQIALFGDTSEAAQVRYDTEFGALKNLSPELKAVAVANAEKLDQMREEAQVEKDLDEAVKQHQEQVDGVLSNLQQEIDLLGKTNEERATYNALLNAGTDLSEADKQAITDRVHALYQLGDATKQQVELMDDFRQGASDALTAFVTGTKSAKEAITDFFDSLAAQITKAIADQWIKKLFGETNSSSTGSSGGWIAAIASIFGGGRAGGGDVSPGSAYLVGENGPEMFVPRTMGTVMTSGETRALAGGGGGVVVNNQFLLPAMVTRQTQEQIAQRTAFAGNRATSRNR